MAPEMMDFGVDLDELTSEWRQTVHSAVSSLSSVCDGAHDRDGEGFNGVDAGFGNSIARVPVECLTAEPHVTAWRLLRKYKRQLLNFGIEYESIPRPTT